MLLTPQAEADIAEIVDYYKSNSASSLWFQDALLLAVDHLEAYPDTATQRRDLTRKDVLFWLVKPYWMVLKRKDDDFFVVAVVHTSRLMGRALHKRLRAFQ